MSRIGGTGWSGRATGWAVPAQAEGEVDGLCFYYRNRGGDESFSVGKTVDEAVGASLRGSTAYYMPGDAEEWCCTDRGIPFEAWLQARIEYFINWFRLRWSTLGLELLRGTPGAWVLRLRPECGGQDLWGSCLIDIHWHADGSHCLAKALYALLPRERQLRYLRRRTARLAGRPGVRVVLPAVHTEPPCPGEHRCHGAQSWCSACGDVRHVCDDPACDQHVLRVCAAEPPPAEAGR